MFGIIECITASIRDLKLHPWLQKKWVTAGIICGLACAIGLVFVQGSGFYWLELFDTFLGTYQLIFIGLMESIAVGWVLGTERFSDDIQFMIGHRPGILWKLAWKIFSPVVLSILLIGSLVFKFSEPLTYRVYNKNTTQMDDSSYPWYALLICAALFLSSMLWPPGVALARKFGLLHYEPAKSSRENSAER
ncbi:transporter [Elysia marginata]|uniref:Transporter n=1 Tax=Elysia marginata TaxID=1093978 RepID=A0AAV4I5T2_9GAST|nr:transporter [Elysia marginata]